MSGLNDTSPNKSLLEVDSSRLSVRAFLENQTDHFLRGDFDRLGNDYDEPILLVSPNGSQVYNNRNAFNSVGLIVRDYYLALGMVDIKLDLISVTPYGDSMLGVEACWNYLGRKGKDLGQRRSSYVLRHYEDSYRIAVHILHTELHDIRPDLKEIR